MDRDEIALKFAVAYLTTPHAPHVIPPWQEPHDLVAREAFNRADAFLAASQPATVASEAPEPRRTVGAVIKGRYSPVEFIVVEPGIVRLVAADKSDPVAGIFGTDEFCRWATREECERHGIPFVARPLPATASERAAAGLPPAEAVQNTSGPNSLPAIQAAADRAAAPEATRSVDREGLAKVLDGVHTEWVHSTDTRSRGQVLADAAIAYFKNGGGK